MTALVDRIAKAVLYEGYMLYPYRPSAIKNRQRFNFGVVYPRAYSEAQGGTDACMMQTQCLVLGDDATTCLVRVRFLRMVNRTIGRLAIAVAEGRNLEELQAEPVQRLEAGGKVHQPWQEAVEEEIEVTEFGLAALAREPMQWPFRLSAKRERTAIHDDQGAMVGVVLREQECLAGVIEFSAKRVADGLYRLTARLSNSTRVEKHEPLTRDEALSRALVSAHTILAARGGEFVSLADPPDEYRAAASACQNIGTWPVLAGDHGRRDTILASPIILYDHPEIAPESPGDLFDGAEIDEILSLRIMTLTEEEKREMRESDDRARQILERTDNLPEEQFMKLHGALRGLRPANGEMP
jgi:hydrogenase maturation protease